MAKNPEHVARVVKFCDEAILEMQRIKAAAQSDSILDDFYASFDAANSAFLQALWWAGVVWGGQIAE